MHVFLKHNSQSSHGQDQFLIDPIRPWPTCLPAVTTLSEARVHQGKQGLFSASTPFEAIQHNKDHQTAASNLFRIFIKAVPQKQFDILRLLLYTNGFPTSLGNNTTYSEEI